jgi:hypothetical protein
MFDPLALAPFPNAIFWNWCTVIILAFGNRTFLFALNSLLNEPSQHPESHIPPSLFTQLAPLIFRYAAWPPILLGMHKSDAGSVDYSVCLSVFHFLT